MDLITICSRLRVYISVRAHHITVDMNNMRNVKKIQDFKGDLKLEVLDLVLSKVHLFGASWATWPLWPIHTN